MGRQRHNERSVPVPHWGTRFTARALFNGLDRTDHLMLRAVLFVLALGAATCAQAQTSPPAPAPKECPPGTSANAPGLNDNSSGNLSDKLAASKGIICPPSVDPHMQQKPPEGGAIKVVPPPGSPGGDQRIQPK